MRRIAITLSLALLATLATSHAQWGRDLRYDPKTDPNAFKITARADLEESLSRVQRLKGQLAGADDDERDFVISNILELCQQQLNDRANVSGVIVVEKKDFVVRDFRGNVDEDESVYDVPVRWQGAYSAVEQEILSLGERGLELYEEIYGARAGMLLEVALRARDRAELQNLNRRFGLTRAGMQAGLALAAMLWEEGEASPCARLLERVLSVSAQLDDQKRAELSAWLAHCYMRLGERANLGALIESSQGISELQVRTGDAQMKLGEMLKRRLLETRDGTTDTIEHLGIEWPGGNYMNTGMHEPPTDYAKVAWSQTLPELRADRKVQQFMKYENPVVPPHLPVFDGTRAYISNGDTLLAYELVAPRGEPAWSVSAFNVDYRRNWRTSEPDPAHIMPVSVYRGTVFAALENPLNTLYHSRDPDSMFALYSHYPKVRRALCAVDSTTGRLLWKLGGHYEGDGHESTNFLSAVVHNGVLYAIASRIPNQAEIFLYAIDPATGDVHWDLRLCYGQQETTMFGRPAREPHPSLPAIANGRLYLCTNIGGVVSVDLASRSIEWISRYDYMPRPQSKYIETYYRDVTFYNNPTIYTEHNGRPYVLCAPTDARKMFAIDARTGEVLWELRQDLAASRGGLQGGRALIGVREGKVFVAGDGDGYGPHSRLHSIAIESGEVTNSMTVTPVNDGRTLMLAGRPALTTNSLLWPGQEYGRGGCTLAEIDLNSMRVVKSASVPGGYASLGYSVFAQHGVVFTVAGKDYAIDDVELAARFNQDTLLEVVRRDYRTNPDDPEAAVRYGLLLLRLDNSAKDEALVILKKAFELAARPPADASVRERAGRALVNSKLADADRALAQRNYQQALEFVAEARRFTTGNAQLTECFRREEQIMLAGSSAASINEFYRRVIRDDPPFGMGDNPEIPVGLYCKIRLAGRLQSSGEARAAVELWQQVLESPSRYSVNGVSLRLRGIEEIAALIESHGREVYDAQETAAAALIEAGGVEDLRRCLSLYPLSRASDTAALELAWQSLQAGEPTGASDILRLAMAEYAARARAAELNALLALSYARANESLRARLLATRVLRESPEGRLEVGGESFGFKELLEPLIGDAEDGGQHGLARLPLQLQQLWERPWDPRGFVRLPPQPASAPHPRFHLGERTPQGTYIQSLEAATGKVAWSQQVPVTVISVFRTPKGTLFHLGQGFSLYDDKGNELWSTPTATQPDPVNLHAGMLLYGTRSTYARTGERLVRVTALDASTGGELWESRLDGNSIYWIAQTPAGVLVMTMGDEHELVLLNAETGDEVARTRLNLRGRLNLKPVVSKGRVLVPDRDGAIHAFDADTLKRLGEWQTRVPFPIMFEVHEDDFIMVGPTAVRRFDPQDDREVWGHALTAVTERAIKEDRIVLGIRERNGGTRLIAFDLAEGNRLFEYDVKKAGATDRLDLQSTTSFDGGVIAVLADYRTVDGRMKLWGFRMVVLNDDGSERFTWEYETGPSMLYVQIATIDDYISLTCGKFTFGFGRK